VDLVYASPPPPPPTPVVPNMVGLALDDALLALKQVGITRGVRQRAVTTAKERAGQVLRQSPPPGTPVTKAGVVALDYWTRRGLVVPNVEKMSVRDAVEALKEAGFGARTETDDFDPAPGGTVIRQKPNPGTTSMMDEPWVGITLARGPSPVSLFVYYETEKDRDTAERLSSYLAGFRLASYRVLLRRQSRPGGAVVYYSSHYESLVKSLVARSENWLSDLFRKRVSLRVSLEPNGREDYILLWVPTH
jgi:hypothetical protein